MSNAEKLFKEGCVELPSDPLVTKIIERLIADEKWISDPVSAYKEIPEWTLKAQEMENPNNGAMLKEQRASIMQSAPDKYYRVIQRYLNNPDNIGDVSALGDLNVEFIHLWNGAEENGWHWDGFEQVPFFLMMYFTDEKEWNEDWGGHFDIGYRILDGKDWLKDNSNVIKTDSFQPLNGRILLCNNQNPRLMHQARKLKNKKINRYTITAGLSLK